ncbi:interferon-induced protein 44-like [Coregonus clupeaformis]|uniref:interferon-induced protein 44-like n=1 Tax=Coregonus clupeaformis TaxID=59861 RepID=UPI001E1C5995|nr:interferon-induced protein 44-like [Coregonus clupeaformis]
MAVSALDLGREKQLLKFFPEPVRLHLLYTARHHGFKMSDLISKFDKVGRFVVIVYLESGTMKGGYLSERPDSYFQEDKGAFVFEIDHQKANVFPVVKHRDSIIFNNQYNNENLAFGHCLNIYNNKDKTLCVDVKEDDTYTPTGWSEELEVPFMDVELHRIQSVGGVLLNPWRELSWTEKERGSLRKNLVSFKPACQSLNRVRVLLMGPPGSGKSSFINSVRSVMFGRVLLLPFIGTATKGFIKKLKSYDIRSERGGKPTALTLCDVLALGEGETTGLTLTDALTVIKGHAPEGHKFQSDVPIKAETSGYRPNSSVNDQIHCAVFVLNACQVMTTSEDLTRTLRTLQAEISGLDIPQVVLLTHVDQVCHAVQEDVKFVYSSRILQEKMQKAAEVVGLPLSYVLPVKNYSSELSVSCNTDILLLSAVHHILQAVDDTYEEYCPPTPADASPVTV